ncbi:UDP-glucose:glycoprotein glucosyltransferase 1 [Trichonephila clavipes]|nr:UDP-glucose:glycoprotein glucosyltransferase 1 [Trichonephila clavipes]
MLKSLKWLVFLSIIQLIHSQSLQKAVSVVLDSKWLDTPLHLEASEFLAEENTEFFWKFIDDCSKLEPNFFQSNSQATIKIVFGYNLFPSKLEFECKQLINSFLCTRREIILQWIPLIAAFMKMNKPTSWPKRLRRCIHLAFRCLFEMPSDFLRTNCDKRISTLTDLTGGKSWSCLLDGQRRTQLSALPRVKGVACFRIITGHDCLQVHLFKIGLADSPLCPFCKSMPMTGEHLSDCPVLLVLSQDNCGVLLPARATSALYWTTRRLMSERMLANNKIRIVLHSSLYLFSESDKLQYDAIIDISSNYLSSQKLALLKFSLALRAYSPTIEMFHQIAYDQTFPTNCKAVADIGGTYACDPKTLKSQLSSSRGGSERSLQTKLDHFTGYSEGIQSQVALISTKHVKPPPFPFTLLLNLNCAAGVFHILW